MKPTEADNGAVDAFLGKWDGRNSEVRSILTAIISQAMQPEREAAERLAVALEKLAASVQAHSDLHGKYTGISLLWLQKQLSNALKAYRKERG